MAAVPDFNAANDPDTLETQEWLEALDAVLEREGPERAHYLLERLVDKARRSGAYIPFSPNTAYINTIAPHKRLDALLQIGAHRGREGFSVEDLRCHGGRRSLALGRFSG